MKQLTQKLKDGAMDVTEVAVPFLGKGMILVQNHYSLISSGTEGGTVSTARKSLLGKAKERPQQAKLVVDTLIQQGPTQTYRAVMKKLDSYSPLGYSSAGVVIDVAPDVKGFSVGDHVACAGAGYANHAEVVSVPVNLAVKLPDDANLSHATYNTLGAIALQGVRQADMRVGETCVVIGLGLLGQLTGLILKASGVKVVGLDISSKTVELASKHSVDFGYTMGSSNIEDVVKQISDGIGSDAVIITAATKSTQPINLAGQLLRKRGTVVVVGDVSTAFEREPDYYKKELELKMSCSYGPGRYDLNYEEKGIDYPAGYVRWTENRNMRAFQELVYSKKVDIDYLTTHRFSIGEAPEAYDLILNKEEHFLGILIEYEKAKEIKRERVLINELSTSVKGTATSGIGFIGAGSYAMSHLLPNLLQDNSIRLTGVMTSSGTSSRSVAEKFGFSFCAPNAEEIIEDKTTNTVFIATRHDTHSDYVHKAIIAGKNVFVEKPLCLDQSELDEIVSAWIRHRPLLMVGYNRRFSPLVRKIKETIGDGQMSMVYRVNAGKIPSNSWIQDRELGGGRVVGEVCHFIDFMIFMNGSIPTRAYATNMNDPENLDDTLSITLTFDNGSIGTICYFANGSKSLKKEYVEIYKDGVSAILKDFKELEIFGLNKPFRKKMLNQDKGQKAMVNEFVKAVKNGEESPIPIGETVATTLTTFKILESLRTAKSVNIESQVL